MKRWLMLLLPALLSVSLWAQSPSLSDTILEQADKVEEIQKNLEDTEQRLEKSEQQLEGLEKNLEEKQLDLERSQRSCEKLQLELKLWKGAVITLTVVDVFTLMGFTYVVVHRNDR